MPSTPRDYTCTRLLRLPDCVDVGGEEPHPHGFCPVKFFVPRFRRVRLRGRFFPHDPNASWLEADSLRFEPDADECVQPTVKDWTMGFGPWEPLAVGFVAGCHLGNDSSWKLQVCRRQRMGASGDPTVSARSAWTYAPGERGAAVQRRRHMRAAGQIVREETRDMTTGSLIYPHDE